MDFLQLAGKSILVLGVANRKSIAYLVGRMLSECGAKPIYAVHTEQRRESVRTLLEGAPIYVCDVAKPDEVVRLGQDVARHAPLHGVFHSIAFAAYEGGHTPFHETPKEKFMRAMDVACYSLVAISRAVKDSLDPDASVVTVSISTTKMASESYSYMGPVKAALDSSLVFLTKSFSHFSRARFNAVSPGLLKTAASAGIPGYVDSYLYAEQVIPRKKAVTNEEAANVAMFLLSPRSSGITAQTVVVDAGMCINYFDDEIIRRVNRP